jgi:beta-lactamase superfamily II metal-dependent hydrolase
MHSPRFNKIIPVLLGMILFVFSTALWTQNLEIHYINVQQGQSTFIIGANGTTILFDGGNEFKGTDEVVPYLQSLGYTTSQALDYIIASHRDTDHYRGLTEVMNYGYDALHVYDNGSDKTNIFVDDFLAAAAQTTAGGVVAIPLGQVIDLGNGATATCVATNGSVIGTGPIQGGQDNENDRSVCLLIEYGNFDYLVTGDMGGGPDDYACTGRSTGQVNLESPLVMAIMPAGSNPMLSAYGLELAHVGHHGSESSTNSDYMNLLTPSVACISVGAGQGEGWYHPRIDVVENVLGALAPCITAPAALVLQTEEGAPTGEKTSYAGYCVGDIVITTDGVNSYNISANGAVSQGPDERTAAGLPATFYFDEYIGTDNPPILYNIHEENVSETTADIVWDTNEPATSLVRYGTTPGSYPMNVSSSNLTVNHSLNLPSLTPYTTYYYVVESTDATSHTTISDELSFTAIHPDDVKIVFSEVFYDTPGTDADEEWIELYNNSPVTIDVGGWKITDNNGAGASYTIPTSTTIAAGTYITIAADSIGFTNLYGYNADVYGYIPALNNDGDALILKDKSGNVKDEIGWEGGSTGGLPVGWGSSTEPSASTGYTIVRTDPMVDTDTYADWSTDPDNGFPQTQVLSDPDQQKVVFSEIFYDTPGYDSEEEWIELYNNTAVGLDIGGWTITDNNGLGATYTIPANTVIAPYTHLTIATDNTGFNALYGYDADLSGSIPALNNDGDTLILKDDESRIKDKVAWEGGATGGIPDGWGSTSLPSAPTGSSVVRTDPAVDTDTYADWSTAPNNGNPQIQSRVVVSEVLYDTPGTDSLEEWIELYNNSPFSVDIGGWKITDNNGLGATVVIPAGETIASGTYYTLAVDSTGFYNLYGYQADLYAAIPALNNDGDTLILKDSYGTVKDAVAWEGGATGGIPDGWGSTSLPSASTGYTVVRTDSTVDTDTYADWTTAPNNGDPQTQGSGPDTTPPVISDVQATSITQDSAVIQWTTDEASDSVVEYGTSSGNYTHSSSDSAMVTAHAVSLSGLTASTTYYYRVKSTDASNNTATSTEYQFTTEDPPPDEPMINVIYLTTQKQGSKTQAIATITVTSNGSPLEGAVVDVTWSGSCPGTDQDSTNSSGEVTFYSDKTKDNPWSFTITVNGITKTGYYWDSGSSEISETVSN